MVDSISSGDAFDVAKRALNGLSARRDMIGQNIANVDTPGYKAQEVSFEGVLKQTIEKTFDRIPPVALKTSKGRHLQGGSSAADLLQVGYRQGGSARADGNNVDIDQELTQMTETGIRYQAITQAVSKKFNLIKSLVR
jgi:flagellar basal-body rod protein FlgB